MVSRRGLLLSSLTAGLLSPLGARASDTVTAMAVDLARFRISLHWKDGAGRPYGTIQALADALAARGARVAAVTNAGIYERDGTPLGLHVENGVVLRPINRETGAGNFYLMPNGVFAVSEDGARISETSAFGLDPGVRTATQSGPLLVLDGAIHPAFRPNSSSRRSRNAVGVRADGAVVLAMTRAPVNLWTMAKVLRDDLGCPSALYLDGVISQLWVPGGAAPETRYPYVGMLAVTER